MDATEHRHVKFCQQLLLDCDDPIFQRSPFVGKAGRPTKKMRDLARENSEDAVTWSVFRLLDRHFSDQPWLSGLLAAAGCDLAARGRPQVSFWVKGYPSPERLLWLLENTEHQRVAQSDGARDDPKRLPLVRQNLADYREKIGQGKLGQEKWVLEGRTELDAVIRCPGMLVAVEAKLYSDVAAGVRWDRERDQIARVIDAGLRMARGDQFVFVLVTDRRQHEHPRRYELLMDYYRSNPPERLSGHRLGWLTWGEIYGWLHSRQAGYSTEHVEWMEKLEQYLAERSLLIKRREQQRC